ncbi:unnamed protein product [Kuraishia capsulata CBS 1993]|uniref:Aminopeptidase n=1 Tax=Kuraishia capsulata CBS 1993 TaxID=1382522 RepID=W6MHH6_9ASCO|nr:uncharacterized protein KUCA_T00001406001 [Kuraishia capsulata CBS 1993]CDK25436.1 unnamed protein product [Kuraishia capsulata CBS 1993]
MTERTRELLPKSLLPTHYGIRIYNVDVASDSFDGYVEISMDVASPTDELVINSKYLEIKSVKLTHSSLKTTSAIEVGQISYDEKKETVTFKLSQEVTAGKLIAAIQYSAKLREDMTGFFKSPYQNSEGKTEYLLVTQFEATDARAAFPCFDEPNLKATFDVTVVADEDLTVLSNMPVAGSKTLDSGKKGSSGPNTLKEVKFETTVKMSTYLLAWSIGKLEYVEAFTKTAVNGKHIPVRVYTLPGLIKDAKFALDTATKTVDYFTEVFDVDYPIPKLDLLATPTHGSNAMENFGLVTFRTSAIIFDESSADFKYKKRVAYIVAHELAHQWFGNLVTMDWWDELWLNEGFATYVGYLAVDHIYPDFEIFTDFVSEALEAALELDSLRSSHPIEVPIYSALEIDQVFDPISYLKGASIIRMLGSAVGVDKFLKGVSIYLKKHAFGNATTEDLWTSVSESVGYDINKRMNVWTKKQGFPYVTVMEKEDDSKSVVISQHRFLASDNLTPTEDEALWWIPLSLEGNHDQANLALDSRRKVLESPGSNKFNKGTTGVYRVIYEPQILEQIASRFGSLPAEDKIGLIADTTAAASAGLINISSVLSFFDGIKAGDIKEYAVWAELGKQITALSTAFGSHPDVAVPLKKFIQKVYSTGNGLITSWDDDLKLSVARPLLLEHSGLFGVPEAIEQAKKLLKSGVKSNLKLAVWQTLLSNNPSREEFDIVLKEAHEPESASSHEIALVALGSINSVKHEYGDEVLKLFLSPAVPQMDALYLGKSLSSNPAMRLRFWGFFKDNYSTVFEKFSNWTLDRFIKDTLDKFSDSQLVDEVREFFENKDVAAFERRLNQALELNSVRIAWVNRSIHDVKEWLINNGY